MKVKPIKIKIKQPTPTAADRLYAKHQAIRKEKGLPDPSEYKKRLDAMKKEETELNEMDKSASQPGRDGNVSHRTYGSRDTTGERGKESEGKTIKAKQAVKDALGIMKKIRAEQVEQLDELSPETKSSYVSKAKAQVKELKPWTKKGEYKDLAKNLIAKRQKGIAKVSEETELDEQLYKKERFVSGPPKKDFKSHTLVSPKNEDANMMTVQNKSGGRMKVSKIFKDIYKKHGYVPVPGTRNIGEEVKEPTGDLKKACWKGYTAVGMKMKNGRKVPNCVPIKESDDVKADQISTDNQKFPKKAKMSWDDMMNKDGPVKKSRKASIVRSAAKKSNPEDKFVANPILDSDVNPQTNKQ